MAKQKHKEQRAKERIGVTLQLIVGEDDDLINAIRSLPIGERQAALKNVLRQALGMPLPVVEVETVAPDMSLYMELQQQIEALNERLNNPFVPPAPPSVETVDQIDQQTANERKRRLSGANW